MKNPSNGSDISVLLKGAGLRVTPQRQAILAFLMDYHGHATADEIFQSVHEKYPNISLSTVYNTIKHFVEMGLVREIPCGDAASRFDINVIPHYHLMCNKCGKLFDFYLSEPLVFSLPPEAMGFEIEEYQLIAKGTCQTCREK